MEENYVNFHELDGIARNREHHLISLHYNTFWYIDQYMEGKNLY